MKKTILFMLISLFILSGCTKENMVEPSPLLTTSMLTMHASTDNYEEFQQLFVNGMNEKLTKEYFDTLKNKEKQHTEASIPNMSLIKYADDSALLVQISQNTDTGHYEVFNVIEVPQEILNHFNESLIHTLEISN